MQKTLTTLTVLALLLTVIVACAGEQAADGQPTPYPTNAPGLQSSPQSLVSESDRQVLEDLYHVTSGKNWRFTENWLSDAPLNSWYGVETDVNGRVIILDMNANSLSGQLPVSLGRLDQLRELYLDWNNLEGEIPPELGGLAHLELFTAAGNQLNGEIPPELGGLRKLKLLDLGENKLSGEIPPEMAELDSLQVMFLHGNRLKGEIPPTLGNLHYLQGINLGNNQLTGEVPSELAGLVWLNIAGNQLDGCVPISLWYGLNPQLSDFGNVRPCR